MQTSIFLARLIGTPLLIIGVAVLLNQAFYRVVIRKVIANWAAFYFFAAVGLIVGLAIVLAHNVWTPDWRVLITLFGWVNFVRGVVTVLFPAPSMEFAEQHIAKSKYVPLIPGTVATIIGLILCFYGYF